MGIMVYSLLWVMQDFVHQQYYYYYYYYSLAFSQGLYPTCPDQV